MHRKLSGKQFVAGLIAIVVVIGAASWVFGGSAASDGGHVGALDACEAKARAQFTISTEFRDMKTSQQSDGTWWVRGQTTGGRPVVCFLTYKSGHYEGDADIGD